MEIHFRRPTSPLTFPIFQFRPLLFLPFTFPPSILPLPLSSDQLRSASAVHFPLSAFAVNLRLHLPVVYFRRPLPLFTFPPSTTAVLRHRSTSPDNLRCPLSPSTTAVHLRHLLPRFTSIVNLLLYLRHVPFRRQSPLSTFLPSTSAVHLSTIHFRRPSPPFTSVIHFRRRLPSSTSAVHLSAIDFHRPSLPFTFPPSTSPVHLHHSLPPPIFAVHFRRSLTQPISAVHFCRPLLPLRRPLPPSTLSSSVFRRSTSVIHLCR